ncbi:hypothetical protein [Pectobacterium sp. CHL-2024]|uniref:hypothetical protein n=1 Tax=Pectobacterium sp. CHL-2024 TaxID=3377079 RepID=UPI00381555C5
MVNHEWEQSLNKDDSLYFFPVSHVIEGNYKIQFELRGSYNLRLSDAEHNGKQVLLFEYFDEDDDRPASIDTLEIPSTTVEAMIEHLNSVDSIYHKPIYKTIYEWASKLFDK